MCYYLIVLNTELIYNVNTALFLSQESRRCRVTKKDAKMIHSI